MSTTIAIEGLCKHYKAFLGAGITKAVDDVSLTIPAGSLFFLLGPSGCGKTTLLRMVAGFIEPTAGRIRFDGRDVSRLPPNKRNTGMVFQSYALWPHMTVAQNVAFGLDVRKVKKPEREQRVAEALAAVHMDQYAQRKPNQLSGGQQQRVALARALVVRPSVLLLDEPLSNLDAKLRLGMRTEIKRICHDSNITTLYVTHDQKEALSMADGMAVLSAGRIIQHGAPREMYNRPGSKFVADFLGETNFIEGAVTRAEPGELTIHTSAGDVRSRVIPTPAPAAGTKVTCSVRPESIRVSPRAAAATAAPPHHCSLPGRVLDSIYLGETAQHIIELDGGTEIRAFELHPVGAPPSGEVTLTFSPDDAVTLTA